MNMCVPCFANMMGFSRYQLEECLEKGPGPWKLLYNFPEFYMKPLPQPELEDGTKPIDGVGYCSQDVIDGAMIDGSFKYEVEFPKHAVKVDTI